MHFFTKADNLSEHIWLESGITECEREGAEMAVKLSELMEHLKEFQPVMVGGSDAEIQTFRLMKKAGNDWKSGVLYIGTADKLPEEPPVESAVFLAAGGGDTPDAYRMPDMNCTLAAVPEETDLLELMDALQEFFDREIYVAECTRRLMQVRKSNTSIQELMDLGYEMLGNPLLLVDVSLCFIAHAGGNTVSDEPLWEWTLSRGYVTDDYMEEVLEDISIGESGKPLLIWEKGMLNHKQLVYRILDNGVPVGYLKTLAYNKDISESDQQIICALGNCLLYYLTENRIEHPSSSPLVESFLTSLLNQKLYDHNAIEERIHQFKLKLYDNLTLIAIGLSQNFQNNKDQLFILKRKIQNFLARDTILYYNGHLVAIYDSKQPEPFNAHEWDNFERLLASYDCRAGVSLKFSKLYDLPEQYKHAVTALRVAGKLHMNQRIIRYSDVILQHMFLDFSDQNDLTALIHPAARMLKEMDQEKGSSFLETVKVYIKNGLEIVPAAKAMFVHYNTMKYRLNRIVELTGLDFRDSDVMFRLQLSFMIMDIMEQVQDQ